MPWPDERGAWGLRCHLRKDTAIGAWAATIVLCILPAVGAMATGQPRRVVAGERQEIIVKMRAQAVQDQGTSQAGRRPRLPPVLEMVRSRDGAQEAKPLLAGVEGQRARWQHLQSRDKSLLTPQERHLLRRLKRSRMASDVPDVSGIYRVRVDVQDPNEVRDLLDICRRDPDVEYAELSHIVSICAQPNDPEYDKQWSLDKIGVSQAWDTCQGSDEVIVAVIDTGVDYDHRDLQGNVWRNEAEWDGLPGVDDDDNGYIDDAYGYNFAYANNDPIDDNGHGTHCAGIIAAVGNNGLDTAGICWNARIMALKMLDAAGDGTSADAVPAIYYAVANGADVISLSWGSEDESQAIQDAIAYARRQGVLVVAAAGNDDSEALFYPAADPYVIATAATDSSDKRWYLSNHGSWVDIAAPGRDILSLSVTGTSSTATASAFTKKMSGTSMAAPHVSGACALLLAAQPLLTCDEVEQILLSTGDPIGAGICASNARLNVAGAMDAAVPSQGAVRFGQPVYAEGADLDLLLADRDLRDAGTASVLVVTDGGDTEAVTLVETAGAKGVFRGEIASERGVAVPGDGRIQAQDGERLVARCLNAAGQWIEASARADYEAPALVQQTVEIRGATARIDLTTTEPTRAEIRYAGTSAGPFLLKARDSELSDRHGFKIGRLTPGTTYYFVVVLVDLAGNEATIDNEGRYYTFLLGADFAGFRVPSVYPTIQAAIDDAWNGDTVWVADGTYSGEGNIDIDLHGKAITVRSENGPQSCIIDCRGEGRAFLIHGGESKDAVLDGLTITNGGGVEYGGAIRCIASHPTIRNCMILRNSAAQSGGGLGNCYGSSPTVVNCTFQDNTCSMSRLVGWGGALANRRDSSPTIQDCTFLANSASSAGAVGNVDDSRPRIIRCTFRDNVAGRFGGAIGNWDRSHPIFTGCRFFANVARDSGAGMCNRDTSDVTAANCIFSGNHADHDGGAMRVVGATVTLTNCTISGNDAGQRFGGVVSTAGGVLHLADSILWANSDKRNGPGTEAAQLAAEGGAVWMDYCCVQALSGVLGGIGNIAADPLFVDPAADDYHLRSQGWRWDAGSRQWVYDGQTSPCVDAGNPGRALGEEPVTSAEDPNHPVGANARIDMGAYGGTEEASMAPPQWAMLADMTNDRRVDWHDLACLAAYWTKTGGDLAGDLSRDGAVGGADLVLLADQWRHMAASAAATPPKRADGN
ncbi:MAG: S8 family serine peptidase [Sedimentisphaerales bacterium]|nr:S8 family serine peptidase [Sedimentisphaerales bacterium]